MDWQDHFRAAAKRERWSWSLLAKKTGIPPGTLQNWVNPGSPKGEPSITDVIKIAEVMERSLDELFRGRIPDDRVERILREAMHVAREQARDDLEEEAADTA